MEYLIIIALQVMGVAFNVNRKIVELDGKYPDFPLSEIKNIFLKQEGITFIGSALILILHLICHLIVDVFYPSFRENDIPLFIADWCVPYIIASFILAFFLGYFGQWLVYRVFGRAEKIIKDKI